MPKVAFTPLTPKKTQLENRFAIVIDESGSMRVIRQQTIDAFNSLLETIKTEGRKSGQKNTVTLCIFNDGNIRFTAVNKPAEDMSPLTWLDYVPAGGTPLWAAVGETIEKLREVCRGPAGDSESTSFVVQVLTDGEDTGSPGWCMNHYQYGNLGKRDLMAEIRSCEKNGRWTFAFMVPKGTGERWARQWNIPPGNVCEWEATVEGTARAATVMSSATMGYTSSRSAGLKSTSSYFSPDLSKLKVSQVKKLEDLSDRITVYDVKEQARIDEFIAKKNKGQYILGSGYYQLMKKEKVQSNKRVLIREKGKKAIYGGPEARKLLGLPDHELTITPGNHANYDVFVQSKSPNRILPRGTLLAFDSSQKPGEQPTWGTV